MTIEKEILRDFENEIMKFDGAMVNEGCKWSVVQKHLANLHSIIRLWELRLDE